MSTDTYRLQVLPLTEHPSAEAIAWLQATQLAFHRAAASAEQIHRWWDNAITDRVLLRAAYAPEPNRLPELVPAGTYASFDKTVNVGGGRVLHSDYIYDVTVLPTHRRRGLLRQMTAVDLVEARDRGTPLASLMTSEGAIYGRFGFGIATRNQSVEISTRGADLRLRSRRPERVEVARPSQLRQTFTDVFARFHATTRGSHDRTADYLDRLTGVHTGERRGPDPAVRAALHYDEAGQVDGYVVYTAEPDATLRVRDLVALGPDAELGLWQFLGDIDLIERLVFTRFSSTSPLTHALVDPRAVRITNDSDAVWLRILDVVAAMSARGYDHDGAVRLAVVDPLGHAQGTFEIEVTDGQGQVSPTHADPEVTIDIEGLSAGYLGLVSPLTLAAAGRVTGDRAAIARFAQLMQTDLPPYAMSDF